MARPKNPKIETVADLLQTLAAQCNDNTDTPFARIKEEVSAMLGFNNSIFITVGKKRFLLAAQEVTE